MRFIGDSGRTSSAVNLGSDSVTFGSRFRNRMNGGLGICFRFRGCFGPFQVALGSVSELRPSAGVEDLGRGALYSSEVPKVVLVLCII